MENSKNINTPKKVEIKANVFQILNQNSENQQKMETQNEEIQLKKEEEIIKINEIYENIIQIDKKKDENQSTPENSNKLYSTNAESQKSEEKLQIQQQQSTSYINLDNINNNNSDQNQQISEIQQNQDLEQIEIFSQNQNKINMDLMQQQQKQNENVNQLIQKYTENNQNGVQQEQYNNSDIQQDIEYQKNNKSQQDLQNQKIIQNSQQNDIENQNQNNQQQDNEDNNNNNQQQKENNNKDQQNQNDKKQENNQNQNQKDNKNQNNNNKQQLKKKKSEDIEIQIENQEDLKKIEKYDIVLIGGGCSALAFLLNAYRNNQLDNLISKNGLCIIEKTDKFGGGTLEDNLIPSNTPSIGLLKYIMEDKQANMLIGDFLQFIKVPNKNEIDFQLIEQHVLPIFKPILSTKIVDYIKKTGDKTGSLQSFGFFLRIVGNQFLRHLLNEKKYKIHVKFENQVQLIKQINLEENKEKLKEENKQNEQEDNFIQEEKQYIIYYNKVQKIKDKKKQQKLSSIYNDCYNLSEKILGLNVIQCQGGFQKFNPMYEQLDPKKKFTSDQFLKETHLIQALNIFKQNNQRQISIIGGSHSALSAAHILLNGPQFYEEDELEGNSEFAQLVFKSCQICNKNGHNCKCYGNIKPYKKQLKEKEDYQCGFQEGQIKIYHRHQFRTSPAFNTNAYSGLRGLAKDLYERIIKNQEKRVKLVQFSDYSKVKVKLMQSAFVVECLGYETNYIQTVQQKVVPQKNQRNHNLEILQEFKFKQDVDGFALMDFYHQINSLSNCYGTGLGFGLQTEHPLINAEKFKNKKIRADSLQVYLAQLSSKILYELNNKDSRQERLEKELERKKKIEEQEKIQQQIKEKEEEEKNKKSIEINRVSTLMQPTQNQRYNNHQEKNVQSNKKFTIPLEKSVNKSNSSSLISNSIKKRSNTVGKNSKILQQAKNKKK